MESLSATGCGGEDLDWGDDMEIVRFEKCECKPDPHGYFHRGNGYAPVPILSIAAGKLFMERAAKEFEGQDMDALEKQMRDAGLPDTREDGVDILVIEEELKTPKSTNPRMIALAMVIEGIERAIQQINDDLRSREQKTEDDHRTFVV